MQACIESNNPFEIHLLAARLRDEGFHPEVINEAGYVTGYPGAMGMMAVLLPNGEIEAARQRLTAISGVPLPDDLEFADPLPEGGPVLPFTLPGGLHESLCLALIFSLLLATLGFFYHYAAFPVTVWLMR